MPCDALRMRRCETALATAVFIMLLAAGHIAQARAGMLSPTGRCHTFDKQADGFAKGEACGAVTLRLDETSEAATAGPERVRYGTILSAAIKQDGRSASLTAPNGLAQQAVVTWRARQRAAGGGAMMH